MTTPTPIEDLTYEQARDELIAIVAALESGTESLEQAMDLWERGEALATHCENFLDAARARLQAKEAAGSDDAGGDGGEGAAGEGDDTDGVTG